jgi:transcriptional regulator with XRE-family HTH domain
MTDAPRVDHIGVRIRYWRRRRNGMSQAVLAGLAGVTQSYISHVEAGRKSIERRSTLVAIAAALQVSVTDLLLQPGEATDPAYQRASAVVPQLRVRLAQIAEDDIEPALRGVEEMDAALAELARLRAEARYGDMAVALPSILRDAADYGGRYLARVGYDVGDVLKSLGYRDLALTAARIAVDGALAAEDPAWVGATRYFHSLALPNRLQIADRHYAYWTSLGRALAVGGKADRPALVAFITAERAAPVAFSRNQAVRDSVVSMVLRARRRSVSHDLRVLARRLGIEVPATCTRVPR